MTKILSLFSNIGKAYGRVLRSALMVLAGAAGIIALSAAIVTPVWYVATSHTRIYNIVIIAGALAAALGYTAYVLATSVRRRKRILSALLRFLLFALGLVVVYFDIVLFAYSVYAAAIPLAIVAIAGIGLLLHARYKNKL